MIMGMEVTYMDRKRELVLQRLSKIGSLSVSSYVAENEKFKGQPVGTMSIEAAIGTYIMTNQMADYMSVLEESRIISIKKGIDVVKDNTDECQTDSDITDLQDLSESNELSEPKNNTSAIYDKLDANRCAGFLLYSYNKNGIHSVLGEHLTPGGYGGFIITADFFTKA